MTIGAAVPALFLGNSILGIAVLTGLGGVLISVERRRAWGALKDISRAPVGLFVIFTFLCWIPNVFSSVDPLRSFETGARTPVFIAVAILFWAIMHRHDELRVLCAKSLIIVSTLGIGLSLLAMNGLPELISFVRAQGWRSELPIYLVLKSYAAPMMLAIPVLLLAGWRLQGRWLASAIVNVILIVGFIFLVRNRASLAGLLAMVLVAGSVYMATIKDRRAIIATLAGTLIVTFGVFVWLKVSRVGYIPPEIDVPFPGWLVGYPRQLIWQFALELATQAPFMGLGINTINFAPGADSLMHGGGLTMIPSHPHNWMVELYAETGGVGLGALCVSIALVFWRLLRLYWATRAFASIVAILVMVGYWGSGLFNFSFWAAWWQVSFVVLMAIALSFSDEAPRRPA